jgi:hypothetical protein
MKFGEVSLWYMVGPAAEVCAQMAILLNNTWRNRYESRFKSCGESCDQRKRYPLDAHYFFTSFFFLGTCQWKARPVFIVYTKDKYFRHEIVGSIRGLDWLNQNKSGVVATTWNNLVIRQAIIEGAVRDLGWDRGFAEEVY